MDNETRVWLDGEIVKYSDATVPILTHSLQYGSGIFEGIRSYNTGTSASIFRLEDHVDRFFRSMKIYSMKTRFTKEEIVKGIKDVISVNKLTDAYIRPFAFYNDDRIGLGTKDKKISIYIAVVPFKSYFSQSKAKGLRCKVSSWHRPGSAFLPIEAKASGNYLNSVIANREAVSAGYDEAILTSPSGYVTEGPGENIFMVTGKDLITPGRDSDILIGITRDTIINISSDIGLRVTERFVHREELYTADELFFGGTAAEITPILEVDGMVISGGLPGKATESLAKLYNDTVTGKIEKYRKWLSPVP